MHLRRYFIAGLLVWLPIGATILVVKVVLDLMDRLLLLLPPPYRPENLLGVDIPGLGVIVALILVLVTGVLVANLLGRRLVAFYESILTRIPLVRTVYGAVKSFAEVVFSDSGKSFKKVMLIQYPHPGIYALAFQTADNPPEPSDRLDRPLYSVFLPTTPNPTSGFILLVPQDEAIELDMSVEEALKMIISLGVVVPHWHPLHPDNGVNQTGLSGPE